MTADNKSKSGCVSLYEMESLLCLSASVLQSPTSESPCIESADDHAPLFHISYGLFRKSLREARYSGLMG